ncbi:hypothetical protein BGZ95_009047 [Linnemannia exigua]|uniref:Uncharacterized protein n=1 Tax=Linnemannia exigua TaxID=604196 RepID=A0AAD4DF63_9FUNG|nr:hypothetical protein BGZ95_009047 [Linnemannia exigua]
MSLFRDLSSMHNTPVIYLTTLSDPNTLAVHSNYSHYNNNNHSYNGGSGDGAIHDHYQNYQHHHYQHYRQHGQPYASSSSASTFPPSVVMSRHDEEDIIDAASTQQEGKKKKKKKKKKATSAATVELAPEPATTPPPEALSSVNEQGDDDTMTKEFPDLLKSFAVVQGDVITTKSKGKKSKAKKKIATMAEAGTATENCSELAGSKAYQLSSEDERQDVTMMAHGHQEPVSVSGNLEHRSTFGDIGNRQVLYSSVASGKDSLDFLNDDFMNAGLSNWADDIDEYEQTHDPPLSVSTASPTAASTTTVTTSPQQTALGDATPKTLVYKGSVVTQMTSFQSHDARCSSTPDLRKSHPNWKPAPRPFKARSWPAFHEQPDQFFEYQQPRASREYSEPPSEYHRTPFGEYPGRLSDDHQRPLTRYQPAYSHQPSVYEPLTYSCLRPMPGGRPPYQHQTLYPSQSQVQQQYFERAMLPTHLRPTGQLQQPTKQPTKQPSQLQTQPHAKMPPHQLPKKPTQYHHRQRTTVPSSPSLDPTPAQALSINPQLPARRPKQQHTQSAAQRPTKQPQQQLPKKLTQEHHPQQPAVVTASPPFDPTPAQAFSKRPKPDSTTQSSTKLNADNPWISRAKPAWMTQQGSREGQGHAESQLKLEVEKKGKGTYAAAASTTIGGKDANTVASLHVSEMPIDKLAVTKPGLDKTLSQSQKKGYGKQEQLRLPHPAQTQNQSQPQDQPKSRDLLKAKSHFRSHQEEQEEIKAVERLWKMNGRSNKSGSGQWGDRNKVIEFFSKRWVEARMSSGGQGSDAAVVYCSSP